VVRHPVKTIRAMLGCALAVLAILGAATAEGRRPTALTARTVSINESGRLHLTSKHGFTLNEEGSTTGTIRGTIYIHLHLLSSSLVTAEVNIYPSGGSISGAGSASYHVNGGYASFSGSLSVSRGSGSYSRAHASRLRFTGTIQRRSDAVAVQLSGPLSV
jgi:hypothetical protein